MRVPGTYCLRCAASSPREEIVAGAPRYLCDSCGAREPRALILDLQTRTDETPRGLKHWTVGALIERDGAFLLMHKRGWPHLWDVIAGHLEVGEEPEAAVLREVTEETGLLLRDPHLVFRGEIFPDPCRKGVNVHEWYLYRGGADGELRPDAREVAEIRWVTREELYGLPLVRPAYFMFDIIRLWDEPDSFRTRYTRLP